MASKTNKRVGPCAGCDHMAKWPAPSCQSAERCAAWAEFEKTGEYKHLKMIEGWEARGYRRSLVSKINDKNRKEKLRGH